MESPAERVDASLDNREATGLTVVGVAVGGANFGAPITSDAGSASASNSGLSHDVSCVLGSTSLWYVVVNREAGVQQSRPWSAFTHQT